MSLYITHLADTGRGEGSSARKSLEVLDALPGEQVVMGRPWKGGKKWLARPLSHEVVSPFRVEKQCPHFPECGGCAFQTLAYPAQLRWKQERIEALFGRAAAPIIGMEEPWHYRNKMEYTFSKEALGLIAAGSRGRVLPLTHCALTPPWFMEALDKVRGWWRDTALKAYHPPSNRGTLRNLILREGRRTGDRMAILRISGNPEAVPAWEELEALTAVLPEIALFLEIVYAKAGLPTTTCEMHLGGQTHLREELLGLTLSLSPASFFQPNTVQAEKMLLCAKALISPAATAWDLYAGIGIIGMALASKIEHIEGFELNPYAVCDGEENLVKNQISHMCLKRADATEVLQTSKTVDLILLDPPREGLHPKALQALCQKKTKEILYISCQPKNQARDIAALCQAGYHINALQPIDQFPHTPHIENIVLLGF